MSFDQTHPFTPYNVLTLADRVLSLDEPWRSRFLNLITGGELGGLTRRRSPRFPSPSEVALWLCDPGAYCRVGAMVTTWTHTG